MCYKHKLFPEYICHTKCYIPCVLFLLLWITIDCSEEKSNHLFVQKILTLYKTNKKRSLIQRLRETDYLTVVRQNVNDRENHKLSLLKKFGVHKILCPSKMVKIRWK